MIYFGEEEPGTPNSKLGKFVQEFGDILEEELEAGVEGVNGAISIPQAQINAPIHHKHITGEVVIFNCRYWGKHVSDGWKVSSEEHSGKYFHRLKII